MKKRELFTINFNYVRGLIKEFLPEFSYFKIFEFGTNNELLAYIYNNGTFEITHVINEIENKYFFQSAKKSFIKFKELEAL